MIFSCQICNVDQTWLLHLHFFSYSEIALVNVRASVMVYDEVNKKWVPSVNSPGLSKVQIYQHTTNNTFRVVGRKLHDHEVRHTIVRSNINLHRLLFPLMFDDNAYYIGIWNISLGYCNEALQSIKSDIPRYFLQVAQDHIWYLNYFSKTIYVITKQVHKLTTKVPSHSKSSVRLWKFTPFVYLFIRLFSVSTCICNKYWSNTRSG